MVWLDSGRPFDTSLTCPWLDDTPGSERHNPYLPLVYHQPNIAISPPELFDPAQSHTGAGPSRVDTRNSSLALLPSQYGTSLDQSVARVDAFYAFSELISMASNSENQFLNLLATQIDTCMKRFHGSEDRAIDNLQYFKTLIQEHVERTEQLIYLLEHENKTKWPQATDHKAIETREATRLRLLSNHKYLFRRGETLVKKIQDGTSTIQTDVMARASQKSIEQARKIGRVTLLAYFFLPLSFVTSIFGMNMVSFDNTKWGIVALISVLCGVLIPPLILCFWEEIKPLVHSNTKATIM